jgi:hypothetical protein
MKKFIGLTMLLIGASALVRANGPAAAPEIDPASGAGALALLSGALLVIRGRRKK